MLISKKWAKVVALALSLPSTIFVTAWLLFEGAKLGYYSKTLAVIIFMLIVCNTLFMMAWYAIRQKDKP